MAKKDGKRTSGGKRGQGRALPSKAQILDYLTDAPASAGKREIARAFGVSGAERVALKEMLREMRAEGLIARGPGKSLASAGALPSVAVLEITDRDPDGELLGQPLNWKGKGPPPSVLVAPDEQEGGMVPPIGIGDRVLARILRDEEHGFEARVIRRIGASAHRLLGVYRAADHEGRVTPVDRKARAELVVSPSETMGAQDGELVLVEVAPQQRGHGLKRARVRERLGPVMAARSISLIAIHAHGIPTEFPPEALAEAEAARPVRLGARTDLRDLPLLTIDPEDARDHDDAVWAAPDPDPANPEGWVVVVAIADVGHYVRAGGALDREAQKRGNSAYFPDRVVPMLPERLSADLCSLKAGRNRPCLAVRMIFDREGRKRDHVFLRGLMRAAVNLSYGQVQRAIDGAPDDATAPLLEPVLRPLYGAYRARLRERAARQPLDIDMPERRIELDEEGNVVSVRLRERFDAHRLIEEFMIAANVCAAETLEARRTACMYRVHEEPAADKIAALRDFLHSIEIPFAKGQVIRPAAFNRVLARAAETPHRHVVNEVVLRTQMQAYYSPENFGHFGLNLARYAHFTSPIRRYADLLVHRGLIRALGLGKDGLRAEEVARLAAIGEEISHCERRAMAAERDSSDRYLAAFLSARIGAEFEGRISGVSRFGLFVALHETGADGIVPISTLGDDYFRHDESRHALVGERSGRLYRLGDAVTVRLAEANPISGGMRFELLNAVPSAPPSPTRQGARKGQAARKKKTASREAGVPAKTARGAKRAGGRRSR